MDLKPFTEIASPRAVKRPELPPDLAEFYAGHEGVGLESSMDRPVRLCRLDEVALIRWEDLRSLSASADNVPEGWEGFTALRIGMGMFGEEIVYVLDAPSCSQGSVLAFGRDLAGPGGIGPFCLDSSLVLAETFLGWLAHLEEWEWVEYAVAAWETPPNPQEVDRYYLALNPGLNVGPA